MPEHFELWSQLIGPIVAVISALVGVALFLHNLEKDRGPHAKRSRILEQAKARTEIWRPRLDVQKEALSGSALVRAKEEAVEALEKIRRQANHNLVELHRGSSPPRLLRIGKLRKLLLIYKPVGSEPRLAIFLRIIFWDTLLPFLLIALWAVRIAWLLVEASSSERADAIHRAVHSPKAHSLEMIMGFNCGLLILFSAWNRYQAKREERYIPEIEEITEI